MMNLPISRWGHQLSALWLASFVVALGMVPVSHAQRPSREELVRADRARVEAEGFWLYNDLPTAYARARQESKPIVVVLRCIPCEECVKLDDELVDTHPIVRPLLDQFVCVRVVGTNGLDLDLFQYDTDQSFAVFMLNAEKMIYGRFGTRSHRTEWIGDVSLEGLAEALKGALEMHQRYLQDREKVAQLVAGKRGTPLEFSRPELYPSLKDRYSNQLDYEGEVAKSCIHCHQIGDARREYYWHAGKPLPYELVYPYPHPKSIGLVLDPKFRARVQAIVADTPAAASGLQPGDDIESMEGQPLLSMADAQWVLHQVPMSGGEIALSVRRNQQVHDLTLVLPDGWRRGDDISWRVSCWPMSRMALGGMRLESLPQEMRPAEAGAGMALRVKSVGQYGAHGTAKRQGIRVGDVLLAYDGRRDLASEAAIFEYALRHHRPGERVQLDLLRDGKRLKIELPLQP
ncbi:MAG: peptidase [Pirellulaceae bacterium]|nr:MAG: peptidase [Pirellulaceae bacterium]